MALIQCSRCGEIANDKTGKCAQCGAPLSRESRAPAPPPPKNEKAPRDMFAETAPANPAPTPKPKTSLVACQHCGHGVARDAKACPGCGSTTFDSEAQKVVRLVWVAILVAVFVWWVWPEPAVKSKVEPASNDIERYKRTTVWNVELLIKARLRDPGSYQRDTAVTLVSPENGVIGAVITYRSKNGFGGYTTGYASGNCNMQAEDCKLITLE